MKEQFENIMKLDYDAFKEADEDSFEFLGYKNKKEWYRHTALSLISDINKSSLTESERLKLVERVFNRMYLADGEVPPRDVFN